MSQALTGVEAAGALIAVREELVSSSFAVRSICAPEGAGATVVSTLTANTGPESRGSRTLHGEADHH